MLELTSEIRVELVQQCGGDHMVVHAARVSTRGQACREDVGDADGGYGLIRYLMKYRHGTPFEHSLLTFFVRAPIFVFREWHRHRVQSFSEESARYKQLAPLFWVPRRHREMVPVPGFKPARPSFLALSEEDNYLTLIERMRLAYEACWDAYESILSAGIAKEVARAVLPVGTYSSCWVTCNPRSLMAFLSLRTHEPEARFVSFPQAEIEEAARACEELFRQGWPLTYRAFCECGRVAP